MEQRTEFALKALESENFRALCQEYGMNDFIELRGQSGQFFLFSRIIQAVLGREGWSKVPLPSVILSVDFELDLVR